MWTAVWVNVVAWGVLFAAVVLARYHGAGLARRVEAALVRIQEKTLQ
jgi:heme exporter protein C